MMIFEDFKYKIECYYEEYSPKYLFSMLRSDGTSAMILYRLSQFFVKHHLGFFAYVFRSLNKILNGCWIGRNANFDRGFVIMHSSGVVINSGVKGGRNIVVQSGVVIGAARNGPKAESPTLGNNIFIGAGAKILGGIKIADNTVIGANAVVMHDIPNNATVVGVPGRVVRIG
jgi:serine O-acetyltransferase